MMATRLKIIIFYEEDSRLLLPTITFTLYYIEKELEFIQLLQQ